MSAVTQRGSSHRAKRSGMVRGLALWVVAAAIVSLCVGFIGFARGVTGTVPPRDASAEGIVVLTGGAARIDGALRLLVDGRAERLLITGVHPKVTRQMLAGILPDDLEPVLRCCADLDHQARDTIENAAEARRWVDKLGFRSLIVVTSNYHMPRSMTEFADAMPDVRLTPFPVSNPGLSIDDWWRNPTAFGLLASEYGKLLLAEARQFLPGSRVARAAAP